MHLSVSGHAKVNGITFWRNPSTSPVLPALRCALSPNYSHWHVWCWPRAGTRGTAVHGAGERINTHLTALHGWRGVCRSLYWIPHGPCTFHFKLILGNTSWDYPCMVGLQHSEAQNCANTSCEQSLISSSNWTVLQHTEELGVKRVQKN